MLYTKTPQISTGRCISRPLQQTVNSNAVLKIQENKHQTNIQTEEAELIGCRTAESRKD